MILLTATKEQDNEVKELWEEAARAPAGGRLGDAIQWIGNEKAVNCPGIRYDPQNPPCQVSSALSDLCSQLSMQHHVA